MDRLRHIFPDLAAVIATLLTAVVATGVQEAIGQNLPLTVFLLPIVVTGYFGSVRAALLAVALSTLAGSYVCFEPIGSFRIDDVSEQVRLAGFLIVAAGIAVLTARLARIHHDLVASETRLRRTVTDLNRAQDHQQLLLRELKHRIRNMLATIDSLARQTAHHSRSLPAFQAAFSERVRALAQVNDILTSANWAEIPVRQLIEAEVAARTLSKGQAVLDGPQALLDASSAVALHMVIHELCTNSVKYGSLSVPFGQVLIRWDIVDRDAGREFALAWEEAGGPPVVPPRRRGFGSELLQQTIEYELGGRSRLDFARNGLVCELTFPWNGRPAERAAAPEPRTAPVPETCPA